MDLLDTAISSHNTSFQQDVLNNSTAQVVDSSTTVYILNFVLFITCLLGLPGNVLVIAVYIDSMTTSTRVYMFALAVVDSVVCVCGVILTGVKIGQVLMHVVDVTAEVSHIFSVFLLVFIAIERLIAVRRPHTFSVRVIRAKRALAVNAAITCVAVLVHQMLKISRNVILLQLYEVSVFLSCLLILSCCYIMVAVTLIKKSWSARAKVESQGDAFRNAPGPLVNTAPCSISENKDGSSSSRETAYVSSANTVGQKPKQQFKGLSVLLVVTVAFIASYIPTLVSTSKEVLNYTMVHSVINPFIYSFMSGMFRNDIRQFSRKIRLKLTEC